MNLVEIVETVTDWVATAVAALALTISGGADAGVWVLPDTEPATNFEQVTTAPEPELCMTVLLDPSGPSLVERVWGGLGPDDVQMDVVGEFLVIAFDQRMVDSWDQVQRSIPVTGLDEVQVCR